MYLLSSEEEQDVSLDLLTHVYLQHGAYSSLQVVTFWLRRVEDLHRVSTTRHAHQGRIVKVVL